MNTSHKNKFALRVDQLVVALTLIALLASACVPVQAGGSPAVAKPGADVEMVLVVTPEQPTVGEVLAIQITATARAAVTGARIELVLPENLQLTGDPVDWAGDLQIGDQVSLETTAQVLSLPMVEPMRAILWLGSTPHNTVIWPVSAGSSKAQRPADVTLEYVQDGESIHLTANITALMDLPELKGSFVLPDGFAITAGAEVWEGALLANESRALRLTAQVDGAPHGRVQFRLETFGGGSIQTEVAFDGPSPEALAANESSAPRGRIPGGDRPTREPQSIGEEAPAPGAEMQSAATRAADITIVPDPGQPALDEEFALSVYILPNIDLGETTVEIGVPEIFTVISGETTWQGSLASGRGTRLSLQLKRTSDASGELGVLLTADDGTNMTASRWFGGTSDEAASAGDVNAQAGTLFLSGRFLYLEDETYPRGAAYVDVDVYDYDTADGDDWICTTTTDDLGYWSCSGTAEDPAADDTLEVYAWVFAWNSWYGAVRMDDASGTLYQFWTPDAYLPESGTTHDFGAWLPPLTSPLWDGAWHIQKMLRWGSILSSFVGGDYPPTYGDPDFLNVYWPSLDCGTSCYSDATIWLLGPPNTDRDEWDEAVILHEYGHYIMDMFADMNPPGVEYCHDAGEVSPNCGHSFGSHEDVNTAYIEGWANYFEAAARSFWGEVNPHIYSDDYGGGILLNDYELGCAAHAPASTWNDNEGSVTCILWDINDTPSDDQDDDGVRDTMNSGHGELHNIFSHYDPAGAANTPWTIDEFYTGFIATYASDAAAVLNIYYENGINKGHGPDAYEPADNAPGAYFIAAGSPQSHSIYPAADEDWVEFTLWAPSNVTLRTTGPLGWSNDTQLFLYNSSDELIGFDDDGGPELYSLIRRCGASKLSAGTYFVKVSDYAIDRLIPSYNLVFAETCQPTPADFGVSGDPSPDGSSEVVVYRGGAWLKYDFATGAFLPANGAWTGNPGGSCIPAPMDFDGDGAVEYTQLCGGSWNFYSEVGGYIKGIWVGNIAGLRPVPADYDGDGRDDIVVFNAGAWNKYDLVSGNLVSGVWTGNPGGSGIPAPMDYNGDGAAEPAILSGGAWHFYNANGSYNKGIWVGNIAGQLPVPGDYNGDGTDDVWVYRSGAWLPYNFTTGAYLPAQAVWTGNPAPPAGGGATKPAPMDYDGDGKLEFTVFAGGPWHFFNDNGSYLKGIWVGKNVVDKPISRRLLP